MSEIGKRVFLFLNTLVIVLAFLFSVPGAARSERIKDIAFVEGVRDNQLVGYGLVVGLNGTGDKGKATLQSVANMLLRMGLTVKAGYKGKECSLGYCNRFPPAVSQDGKQDRYSCLDRKSTRLNSSHTDIISYAVFCLKKKK